MKAQIECIKCIFNQIYRVAKQANVSDDKMRLILNITGEEIRKMNLNKTPPEVAQKLYMLVSQISSNDDPYREVKREHIQKAKRILRVFKENIHLDDLLDAIKFSVLGNAIDLGSTFEKVNINTEMLNVEEKFFSFSDYEDFSNKIEHAKKILILSDNAGETVFDIPLIEYLMNLKKDVNYAVKSKPIINDATYEDAILSGIKCKIIKNGSSFSGNVLSTCSKDFIELIKRTDLIIAKGQANFETLSSEKLPIFFLFKVKCIPVSEASKFNIGSLILIKSKAFRKN